MPVDIRVKALEAEVASLKEAIATQDQILVLVRQDLLSTQTQLAVAVDCCDSLAERVDDLARKLRYGTGL